MSESTVIPIRHTRESIEQIDLLVKAGLYKNRSEALRDAARRLILQHYGILRDLKTEKSSVQLVREIRSKMWKDAMKKAKGNERKAAEMIIKEANSIEI